MAALDVTLSGFARPARIGLAALLLGLVAVWLMTLGFNDYLLTLACFVGLNVMLATSLTLSNGCTGLFSLGHPGFMTVGGYLAAVFTYPVQRKSYMMPELPDWIASQQWDLLPATLLGGVGAALVAVVIGFPVLRLRGHYLAVATLGFIIIVRVLIINMEGYTRGGLGLNGLPLLTNLWWVFGWTALTLFVCWRIKHSSLGRAMLAIRENEMAAQCMGIKATRTRLTAFVIGAFFAGVAGVLWTHLVTVITPGSFSIMLAFTLVVMVVIGGSGSLTGAVIAAVALSVLAELIKPFEQGLDAYGLSQIVIALGLLLVLMLRPKGLFGSLEPAFIVGRANRKE
ncbi:MAG: branched-chain amino acid ABC transporter permease [Kiloniellales bacterium]|nr:branched-chain amino acid ABC transporter permease [Kiloniellales bacterium]